MTASQQADSYIRWLPYAWLLAEPEAPFVVIQTAMLPIAVFFLSVLVSDPVAIMISLALMAVTAHGLIKTPFIPTVLTIQLVHGRIVHRQSSVKLMVVRFTNNVNAACEPWSPDSEDFVGSSFNPLASTHDEVYIVHNLKGKIIFDSRTFY